MIKKLTKLFDAYGINGVNKSLHLAISQGFIAFLFIIIDFIFSKQLTLAEFGVWKEIFFFFNLGIPLLSIGLPEGYKYFIAKEQQLEYYFKNIFAVLLIIASIVFAGLCLLNALHWFGWVNLNIYFGYSLLFPLPLLAFLLNKTLRYTYINLGMEEKLTALSLYGVFGSIVVIFAGAFFIKEAQEFVVLFAVLIYFSIFFFPSVFYYRSIKLNLSGYLFSKKTINQMLLYGFPLYLATFVGVLSNYLDKLIVNVSSDDITFAIFAVGAFEIPIFAMLSAAFSQQIFPKMVRFIETNDEEKAKKLWIETTKKISLITYPIILLAMFFAEEIIFLIYSGEYKASVFLFKTYLLVALFRNNNYGILLTAKGETKTVTKIALGMLGLNLIASLLLYSYYGLSGIVFGTLISNLFFIIVVLVKEKIVVNYLRHIVLSKKLLLLTILVLICYFLT